MQAIITKYCGPSNSKPTRIKAMCDAGSIFVEYDHSRSTEQAYAKAAMMLARKLGWNGPEYLGHWRAGSYDYGYVFVFVAAGDSYGGYQA